MKARTSLSNGSCSEKPSRAWARSAVKTAGQPPTMAATAGSGARRTQGCSTLSIAFDGRP